MALALAQPRVLPPVEIGSDAQVRVPLIKKPIPFSQDAPADTIPPLIPPVYSLRHQLPQPSARRQQHFHLEFRIDTSVETRLSASYNPDGNKLPLLNLDAEVNVPTTNFASNAVSACVQTDLAEGLNLNHLLSWQDSKSPDFRSRTLSYSLFHANPVLTAGKLNLTKMNSLLSLERLSQSLAEVENLDFALGLSHSHVLGWKDLKFTNRLALQDKALGLAAQVRLLWLERHLPGLDLGLMTDFSHMYPAIDLHKRILLGQGRYLEISNRTELQGSSIRNLRILYPWSQLPQNEKIVMTPLNLSLAGWQSFGDEDAMFRLAGIQQNLRYSSNQPELTVLDASGQTSLGLQNIFSYKMGGNLRLQLHGWEIGQDLELNLEYLPNLNWLRRPFSPLLQAETRAGYRIGDLDLLATLKQEYWRHDELNQPLPAIVDLGLALEYPVRKDLRLTARLDNIFNSIHQAPGNLPGSERSFSLTLGYLPGSGQFPLKTASGSSRPDPRF